MVTSATKVASVLIRTSDLDALGVGHLGQALGVGQERRVRQQGGHLCRACAKHLLVCLFNLYVNVLIVCVMCVCCVAVSLLLAYC